MNIRQGMFRLWVALSIVWISGVAIATWRTFPVDMPPFDPDAFLEGKPQRATKPKILTDEEFKVFGAPKAEIVKNAAALALIPPALSLVFGVAVGWVVRGFRKSK